MTCGTKLAEELGFNDEEEMLGKVGLAQGHAYSLLAGYEFLYQNKSLRLV